MFVSLSESVLRLGIDLCHRLCTRLMLYEFYTSPVRRQPRYFDTIAEWKAVVSGIDEKVFAEFEWQARELAGLMLVPQNALAAEFGKAATKIRAAGMSLEKAKEAGRFSVEDNLARGFVVPRFMITDRTNRDKLWP